jgi:polyisoprenoid-binding protein YceI
VERSRLLVVEDDAHVRVRGRRRVRDDLRVTRLLVEHRHDDVNDYLRRLRHDGVELNPCRARIRHERRFGRQPWASQREREETQKKRCEPRVSQPAPNDSPEGGAMARTRSRKWLRWVIAAGVVVVALVVAAPFVYIHFIEDDPAPRLQLSTPSSSTIPSEETTPVALAGTWTVGSGSTAQYRVDEVLFGQDNTATGKTSDVTGRVTIDGTTVKNANVTVDLTTVKSDEQRRDNQFQGRIMNTAQFPNATFELTAPIDLGSPPAPGTQITVPATGELTLHGVTKPVTIDLKAQQLGDTIEVNGTLPVKFADYDIPNPSFGGISVKDHGEFEFLVKLTHT